MKKKKLLIGVIVVLFLAILAAALYKAWPLLFPTAQVVLPLDPDCKLRSGSCVSLDEHGYSVSLSIEPKHLPLLDPLSLRVGIEGIDAQAVSVDFSGVDMFMGYNRVNLDAVGDGLYIGEGRLPVCTQESMIWEAKIMVQTPKGLLIAPFRFVTYRDPDRAPAPEPARYSPPDSDPALTQDGEPEIPRAVFSPGMVEPELISADGAVPVEPLPEMMPAIEDAIPVEPLPDMAPVEVLTPSLPPVEATSLPTEKLSPPPGEPVSAPKASVAAAIKPAAKPSPRKPVTAAPKRPVFSHKKRSVPKPKPMVSQPELPPSGTSVPVPETAEAASSEAPAVGPRPTVRTPASSENPFFSFPAGRSESRWKLDLPGRRKSSPPKKSAPAPLPESSVAGGPAAEPVPAPTPAAVAAALASDSAPSPAPEEASPEVSEVPVPPPAPAPKKPASTWRLDLP